MTTKTVKPTRHALGVSDRNAIVHAGETVADPQTLPCARCGGDRGAGTGDPMMPGGTLCAPCDDEHERGDFMESRKPVSRIPLWQRMARVCALREAAYRSGDPEGVERAEEALNALGRALPDSARVLVDVSLSRSLPESLTLMVMLLVPGRDGDGIGARQGHALVLPSLAWGCRVELRGFEDLPEAIREHILNHILMALEKSVPAC